MSNSTVGQTAWQARSTGPMRGRFCPDCGGALFFDYRGGVQPPSCPACGFVRRRFPTVGVAVIVLDDDGRVLMGRRAHGEYAGLWCIPCGRLEWGEDVRAGAEREFLEETGLSVRTGAVFAVHSNFHDRERLTVGIWFSGEIIEGELRAADGEFTEVGYFDAEEPPPLAFPTDAPVLADLASGRGGSGRAE